MWKGKWNDDHTVYTGSYKFPDGTVFDGEARYFDKHIIVHMNSDGFSKTVETPVEPHYQFHGTWDRDGMAGSLIKPPDPE